MGRQPDNGAEPLARFGSWLPGKHKMPWHDGEVTMWQGDRWNYVPWLAHQLFPDDWEKQSWVSWAVYAEGLPLTYDLETDMACIRTHLHHASRSERI